MKRRDVVVIAAVAMIAGIVSIVVSQLLFGGNRVYNLKAPRVEAVSAQFNTPDKKYFNNLSINPTKIIQIGDTTNPDAIKNSTQTSP
jgi:hypothetical protein